MPVQLVQASLSPEIPHAQHGGPGHQPWAYDPLASQQLVSYGAHSFKPVR